MQFLIQIFIIRTFVCVTKTSDIRIFVQVNFLIQIYLDIHSCQNVHERDTLVPSRHYIKVSGIVVPRR